MFLIYTGVLSAESIRVFQLLMDIFCSRYFGRRLIDIVITFIIFNPTHNHTFLLLQALLLSIAFLQK